MLARIHKSIPHRLVMERHFHCEIHLVFPYFESGHGSVLLLLGYRSSSCTSGIFNTFTGLLRNICDDWNGLSDLYELYLRNRTVARKRPTHICHVTVG